MRSAFLPLSKVATPTGNAAGTALNYETMKRALSLRRAHKA